MDTLERDLHQQELKLMELVEGPAGRVLGEIGVLAMLLLLVTWFRRTLATRHPAHA